MRYKPLISILFAAPLIAAAQPLYKVRDCNNLVVTADIHECLSENYAAADAKLNEVYQAVMRSRPDQAARDGLRSSERAWIRYRDKHCNDEAEPEAGGTIVPLVMNSCYIEETDKRIRFLQNMMTCTAGVSVCNPH